MRTSPTRQRMRRRTGSGDRAIDEKIRALVTDPPPADADLLEDIVETAFRIARTANRGEMKLVSAARSASWAARSASSRRIAASER